MSDGSCRFGRRANTDTFADGQLTHGFRLRFLHQSHGAAASTQNTAARRERAALWLRTNCGCIHLQTTGFRIGGIATPPTSSTGTAVDGAIQAEPDVPAIPTIARKSPQIPNFRVLLLCC